MQCTSSRLHNTIIFSHCSVAKRIAPSDANQDLDLNADLFVMYGVGPTGTGAASLSIHNTGAGNPLLSEQRMNPAVDSRLSAPVSYYMSLYTYSVP